MNLPNKITITRFVLSFVLIITYCLQFIPDLKLEIADSGITVINLICAVVFIVASITDAVDGHIARSRNLITNFGKFMDPLADKFLVDSSLILLACEKDTAGNFYIYPFIVVLFIGRDLAVDGLRMIAVGKGKVLAANIYGKIKTVLQMVIIPVIFLHGFPFSYLGFTGAGDAWFTYIITNVLAGVALIASLASCFIYFKDNISVLKEDDNAKN